MSTLSVAVPTSIGWNKTGSCHLEFGRQAKLLTAIACLRTRTFCKFGSVAVSCLSWKWRGRSSVKIAERTYAEGTEALHGRREGSHLETASFGHGAGVGPV